MPKSDGYGNLKPIHDSERAKELQKKAVKKRKENREERKLIEQRILEKMGASDWDEVINGVIQRAKESDKGFEVLRDTIGEKPKERVDLNSDIEIVVQIDED